MADLTPKQEKFAQCVASGMTQSDAYRAAYSVGEKTKPETVQRKASELAKDGKISARVAELRKPIAQKAQYTLETAMKEADKAYLLAERLDKPEAMVSAAKLRAQLAGVFVDRKQIQISKVAEGDTESLVAARNAILSAKATSKAVA
jgi:hypothetical protein